MAGTMCFDNDNGMHTACVHIPDVMSQSEEAQQGGSKDRDGDWHTANVCCARKQSEA